MESSVLCVGVISKVTNTQVSAINANESQLSLTPRHIVLATIVHLAAGWAFEIRVAFLNFYMDSFGFSLEYDMRIIWKCWLKSRSMGSPSTNIKVEEV